MPSAEMPNVVLPIDLSERIREKVRTGKYASESELIAESLTALDEREVEIETWIDEEVIPVYDAWEADPSRASPIEDAFARLNARIAAERSKAAGE
jgi:Arc/MetJ-type ribon-helix-helix transcriptional regulator